MMKIRHTSFILILLLIAPLFLYISLTPAPASAQTQQDFYFGVDVAYENVTETKQIIDRVSEYTNLFVIGCCGNHNSTRLAEISDYVYSKNLSFIVYTDDPRYPNQQWYNMSKSTYGNKFLGLYLFDEPGGHQLDREDDYLNVWNATDYADATAKYVKNMSTAINYFSNRSGPMPVFTSDYALYWYDFNAGFDTVFAEFGWNYSRQINTALCRGAATVQDKDWGVMITWTYTQPPYIESGPELYNDMILAYESGAKYVIVFDSNEGWTATILKDEHYDALQQFWQYVQNNPRKITTVADRVAYVLPDYYAYGFRGPTDKIWGIWETDSISYDLSMGVGYLLMLYVNRLDIVYENGQPALSYGYEGLVYWNDTRIFQPQDPFPDFPLPDPPSSWKPTSTPTLTPTPTQSPTASPNTSILPPLTSSASPTQQPPSTPEQKVNPLMTTHWVYAMSAGTITVGLCIVGFCLKRKRK